MKKLFRVTGIAVLAIGAVWTILTVWAESAGPKRRWELGDRYSQKKY